MNARSHLYVPANDLNRLTKALGRSADALIVDLEDGVSPTDKDVARQNVRSFLNVLDSSVEIWVRVNPEKGVLESDLAVAVHQNCRGIVLAKATTLADIENLDSLLTTLESSLGITKPLEISALIESASGVFNAQAIAAGPRVTRLQLGEADLRADLGTSSTAGETTTQFARSMVVFASAAAGINSPVAAVSTNFKDLAAYRKSSQEFKEWGYFGRACIHPEQVKIANEVFSPTAEELADAQDILNRLSLAGNGVALDTNGRMIDEAIAKIARRTLSIGKQIYF
jgi:citrate lyase subunit beta/citryl-CoA lyase